MPPSSLRPRNHPWVWTVGFAGFAYGFHKTGSFLGYYQEFFWFQMLAHLISSTALTLLLRNVGVGLGLQGTPLVFMVVGLAAIGAVGWEVIEYLGIFPDLIWWGLGDSLLDLIMDTAGIATILGLDYRDGWPREDHESAITGQSASD